jgi:hypothetical protein
MLEARRALPHRRRRIPARRVRWRRERARCVRGREHAEPAPADSRRVRREARGAELGEERVEARLREVCGAPSAQGLSSRRREGVPSGTSVTAQPPPPAPVSFVLSAYGGAAVMARICSSTGCETPSATRCSWFSFTSAASALRSCSRLSSGSASARRASSAIAWIATSRPPTSSGSCKPHEPRLSR